MADTTLARMRQILGTAAEWAANDLVLADGEIALERMSDGSFRWKVGQGGRKYSQLPIAPAFAYGATGMQVRTTESRLKEMVYASDFAGYDPTGVADSSTAIIRAGTWALANGRAVRLTGTPRTKIPLVFTGGRCHWIFEGGVAGQTGDPPMSYLIKDAACNGPAISIEADGCIIEGGGVVADAGGTATDNLLVRARGFQWIKRPYFDRAGRDNIRIGDDSANYDASGWYLDCPRCFRAGRHGINIDDNPAGSPNVAGTLMAPLCQGNAGTGLRLGNTSNSIVILHPRMLANLIGMSLDLKTYAVITIGGMLNGNTSKDFDTPSNVVSLRNRSFNVIVGTVFQNSEHFAGTYAPGIVGNTTPGAGTYTKQLGTYTFTDGVLNFSLEIAWTAHNGTGAIRIYLPNITGQSIAAGMPGTTPSSIPVSVASNGFALPAGAQLMALIDPTTNPPSLLLYQNNAGAMATQPIVAAGTLWVNGVVPLISL